LRAKNCLISNGPIDRLFSLFQMEVASGPDLGTEGTNPTTFTIGNKQISPVELTRAS